MSTDVAVRERPILFSAPMVRAILDGRKSVTRRVVKPQPSDKWGQGVHQADGLFRVHGRFGDHDGYLLCPYGAPGDRLWVRETFTIESEGSPAPRVLYQADRACAYFGLSHDSGGWEQISTTFWLASDYAPPSRWRPSIHMPRWASRISLEVTEVRVERLREITEEDARAEGAGMYVMGHGPISEDALRVEPGYWSDRLYRNGFMDTWDQLNAARGYGWDANPWVWVVRFRRVEG